MPHSFRSNLGTVLLGALVMPLAVPVLAVRPLATVAPAASSSVPIPQHPVPATLTLLGASVDGVAVQQGAVTDNPAWSPIYTGPEHTELKVRPLLDPTATSYPRTVLGVTGKTVAWYENLQRAGSQPKAAHRMNLLTGKNQGYDGDIAKPGAFNGESWFSDAVLGHSDFPSNWQRPLRQYHVGTTDGEIVTDILIPNVAGISGVAMAADESAVLRATVGYGSDEKSHYYLDLVDLESKVVTRLLDTTEMISKVALTKDTIIWASTPEDETPDGETSDGETSDGGPITINQRPRAGGPTTAYTETDENADVAHLVGSSVGVGYLVTEPAEPDDPDSGPTTVLRVVTDFTARDVYLPEGGSGLAAVDDRFLTATGGDQDVAGVYSIDGNLVSRVATVPSASFPPQQWSLSAGRFRYTDQSEPQEPGLPVWERTVTGDRRASFSREQRLTRTAGPIAFSASRGVIAVPGYNGAWQLLDRGEVTAVIEALGTPNVSGPYTLIGGKVFRPDGERIYTEPTIDGMTAGRDDLFGSKVIYARIDAAEQAEIWLDDAEGDSHNKLDTIPAGCGQDPQVSIWGELAAWASSCGTQITVRNLRTLRTRTVPAPNAGVDRLFLSEGALTWSDVQDHVLDLTSPSSVPVTLPDTSRLIAVDDHWVARDVRSRPGDLSPSLQMSPLPFSPAYPPRLIARYAPLGFTPNGDGHRDTWTPEFDLTKPVRAATLKITGYSRSKTLVTLKTTAPDGSVRGFSWDGLSSTGVQLPAGLYRWTLTGRARDGDGALIGTDGAGSAKGTVEINLP
ncbi:MAG TPA: hypothetical protein VLL08_03795 [Kineosporiaceae bacterium]|nr:hypothetical protein [Kineosporiaceae bacterium]